MPKKTYCVNSFCGTLVIIYLYLILIFRYVLIVEGELHDQLTLHQRHEDGHYKTRLTSDMSRNQIPNICLPAHLYSQMAMHDNGFQAIIKDVYFRNIIQLILNLSQEIPKEQLNLKAAFWAIGHFASVPQGACYLANNGIIQIMCNTAISYPVYSVRATALYALALISSNRAGAAHLRNAGWNVLNRVLLEDEFYKIKDKRMNLKSTSTPDSSQVSINMFTVDNLLVSLLHCVDDTKWYNLLYQFNMLNVNYLVSKVNH